MDPMVGSGRGGKHSHNSVVGGVCTEDSNSNVVSLLEVCFLCNRRFLYDLTLDPTTTQDDHGLKSEDVLLHMFFEDTSALEKSLLQCCTFCKTLCKSLLDAKTALSTLIDEITSLLRKSRKLASSSSYMLSKPRVITRLFQEHASPSSGNHPSSGYLGNLGNLSATIQLDAEFNINNGSNSGFPSQFMSIGNSNSVGVSEGNSSKFPSGNEHSEHPARQDISNLNESPPSFSFLSPSKFILGKKLNLKNDQLSSPPENAVQNLTTTVRTPAKASPKPKPNKRTKKQTQSNNSSSGDKSCNILSAVAVTSTTSNNVVPNSNNTIMVSNSSGRFILVQQDHISLEENARDVEDNHNHQTDRNIQDVGEQYILLDMMNVEQSGQAQQSHNQRNDNVLGQKSNQSFQAQQPTSFASAPVTTSSADGENKDSAENLNLEKSGENFHNPANANKNPVKTKSKTGGKFACTICPKTFKCNRDLLSHIGSHNQSKPFTCEMCGQSYRQKKALDIHVGIHRGESKFECNHCKKVFTQKISLLRHLPLHTGETVYTCEQCGKGFLHHSSFAHHKLTHSGKRNFTCSVCDQNFFTSSHLKRHFRRHTGEKPFTCNICSKSFNEKSNLKVHLRAVHSKIPAFQCPACVKGFDRKHKLRTHLQNEHSQTLQDQDEAEVLGILT